MEMCKHFYGIFRGSAKGMVGELGQVGANGDEVA